MDIEAEQDHTSNTADEHVSNADGADVAVVPVTGDSVDTDVPDKFDDNQNLSIVEDASMPDEPAKTITEDNVEQTMETNTITSAISDDSNSVNKTDQAKSNENVSTVDTEKFPDTSNSTETDDNKQTPDEK